ncbi:glycosyltransferase family 4 protein [uncultured Cohaesibacter sp.]|uniref:glycosyltransferase family 4 protein n=1 Tax=uncultured Cohaesibacter sp. TaxID=1002546 RepID=UPI002AA6D4A5|nr:glycosyltransferase family 4 protein [uncultured Cohaesibacter sp.]
MKVLNYLPRNMHFGPAKATSIDLCVHQQSVRSEHDILVVCDEIAQPFDDVALRMLSAGSRKQKLQQLKSIVTEFQPDLIVVQQHGPTAQNVAKFFRAIPVMLHRHNFEDVAKLSWFKKWRHQKRYEALQGLIFVSDTCRTSFLAQYPAIKTPLYTVFNGIDCSLWKADADKRNEILFIGRIEPQKNALPAAEAMAQFVSQRPDWSGCLVGAFSGPDSYVEKVKQVVAGCERLSVLDGLPHSAIKERLQEAKISLICSERESFCLVAIESFAAGAGVVSTKNGALPETIGEAGVFLKSLSVEDITAGLVKMADEHQHFAALGHQQVQKFDLQQTVHSLDDVYRRTVG